MPSSPASEPEPPPRDELEELRERYAKLEDRYLRALADVDNVRKRAARDAAQRVSEARDAVVRDWLEVLDSAERAVQHGADEVKPLLEQMELVLGREGVSRLGQRGERFDPAKHEAISVRDTDEVPDRTIVDVARSGYASADHVLRPAQVVVARAPGDGRGAEETVTPA